MSNRKLGSHLVLAGILLFVIESGACIYRSSEYGAETDRLYRAGLNSSGRGRFAWEFWPDSCGIWFWLVVVGLGIRFAGRNVSEEDRPPITHEVALVYHLFPEETGFVTEQGGFFSDLVPRIAEGLRPLPLPQLNFAEAVATLKVRPPKDTKPKLAGAFFESLHGVVTAPLSFELVAQAGAIYFQIVCASADQAGVEQQLALYFPGVEVEPHTPDLSEMIPLAHCRYAEALGNKKTLADFPLDPYASLFTLLDGLTETDGLLVSVKCIPIREATMSKVLRYAELQARGQQEGFVDAMAQGAKDAVAAKVPLAGHFYRGYREGVAERTQKIQRLLPSVIKELAGKMPSWGMTVEVSFTYEGEENPFGNRVQHFFEQYETAEQKWLGVNDTDEWEKYLRFETKYVDEALPYCVVACDELAALAHFPGATTQCQRLERAGVASGLPPALYME